MEVEERIVRLTAIAKAVASVFNGALEAGRVRPACTLRMRLCEEDGERHRGTVMPR